MSDYQQQLAELPSDWGTLPIEEVGEVISGGTPSRNNPRYWGGEIPWVTPGEVTGFGRKHLEETDEKITTEGLAQSGAKLLPSNSLLVTTRASLGAAVLNAASATTNQGFKSIVFTNNFSPDYYYHWASKLKDELVRLASGTTFLEISGSQFRKIPVPAPPRVEQEKIARILDTLDTQIQKTEALIAKLEKVKEGLLHDLLTRGIDENGQLRPSPEQAPELYKESPLGLIPREWVPSSGAQACKEIVVGIVIKPTQYYRASGVPILRSANVRENRLSLDNLMYMAQQDHKAMSKSAVKPGDVLTVRTGYPGTSCVVDGSLEEANCVDIIISRVGEILDPNFWALWINSDFGKGHVLKSQGGLAQQHFNVGDLKKIQLPIPAMSEQLKIVGTWRALQEQIQKESARLEKLQLQKTGLMDELLTGHVRVTPLLEKAQHTTPA